MKLYFKLLPVFVLTLALTGCSDASDTTNYGMNSASSSDSISSKADIATSNDSSTIETSNDSVSNDSSNKEQEPKVSDKLIYTYDISYAVVDKDNQKAVDLINKTVDAYNGYFLTSYESDGRYDLTVKIPTEKRDNFVADIKKGLKVQNYTISKSVENASSTYADYQKQYEIAEENYNAYKRLLNKAKTVDETVQLTSACNNAKGELEYLKRQMQNIDKDVAYTTINISVSLRTTIEPKEEEEMSFLETLGVSFKDGFSNFVDLIQGLLNGIVYNIFNILLIVLIFFVLFKINKKYKKRLTNEKKGDIVEVSKEKEDK